MFHISGNKAFIGRINAVNVESLPAKNWIVKFDPQNNKYYLQEESPFSLPKKIYGNPEKFVKKILNTYEHRPGNLGVLLRGLKGTGKSLTSKMLCIQSGLPVISITSGFHGVDFLSFMAGIKQKVVVFIDEFEKVYPRDAQKNLLTLLDGVFEGEKLFVLTANEKRFHDALMNRPGRIYYSREYHGLSEDIILSVIKDLLLNQDHKQGLLELTSVIGNINLDSLITIIKEMNLYKQDARTVLEDLNITPDTQTLYSTTIEFPEDMMHDRKEGVYGGTMEVVVSSPYGFIELSGYLRGYSILDEDEDEGTPSVEGTVGGTVIHDPSFYPTKRINGAKPEESVWVDVRFDREDMEITPLSSVKLKIKIIEPGSNYEGLEFILTRKIGNTFTY